MSFCQTHWDVLKSGVESRGMMPLVAPSGRAAVYRMKLEIEGSASNSTYDPLMSAHWMIMTAVVEQGGLGVINQCPLCVVAEHGGVVDEWVNGCLDDVLAYVKENGLLDSVKDGE